jgi:hypothetical protein
MAGGRWNKLRGAVQDFIAHLGSSDLVCGIVFNEKVEILT